MARRTREYKVRKKDKCHFAFFKKIFKIFKKKPEIIDLNEGKLGSKIIFVSNHSGASGPMNLNLFFPYRFIPWGAHEMCGNYKERWNYLYHIFYRQKLHWGKFKSFIIATLFGLISKYLYNNVGLIGTYTDARLITTIKKSVKVLDENVPVLIFPEDSSKGYFDKPTEYLQGFIVLAKTYYKKRGEDVPVCPVYFSKKLARIVIGKPVMVNELLKSGKTEKEVASLVLEKTLNLLSEYFTELEKSA